MVEFYGVSGCDERETSKEGELIHAELCLFMFCAWGCGLVCFDLGFNLECRINGNYCVNLNLESFVDVKCGFVLLECMR